MEKAAAKITSWVCSNKPGLTNEQVETMKYGFECILSETSKLLIYFIIFRLLSLTDHFLAAFTCFCIIRLFAGGYHANTYLQCLFVSFAILTAAIVIGSLFGLSTIVRAILIIADLTLIWIFSPVDHPNKPIIDEKRRRNLKYLSVIIFIILVSLTFFLKSGLASTAVMAITMEAISLPLGKLVNYKKGDSIVGT